METLFLCSCSALFYNRTITGRQPSTDQHKDQCNVVRNLRNLMKHEQRQRRPNEWRDRIVGAGTCRT